MGGCWRWPGRSTRKRTLLILGRVRHSFAASKAPLRPWVLVGSNGTVLVAHCTCMAGLAETCSHVGAVLHWAETAVRIRDDTPCTSKENKWLMPTPVKDILYLELRNIDFATPKRQSTCTTNTSTNAPKNNRAMISSPSDTEKQDFSSFPLITSPSCFKVSLQASVPRK